MQIDEIIAIYKQNFRKCSQYDKIIPFLTDYSSGYYAYAINNDKECVVTIVDGVVEQMHSKVSDFWATIIAFYDEGVYFLDEDGYLLYDFEKEGEIGKNIIKIQIIGDNKLLAGGSKTFYTVQNSADAKRNKMS